MKDPRMMLDGWTGAVVTLVPQVAGDGQTSEMKLSFYAGGAFVYGQMFQIWQKWKGEEMSAKEVVSAMKEIQDEIERFDDKPLGPCQMGHCVANRDGVCQRSGVIEEIVGRCNWNISIGSNGS